MRETDLAYLGGVIDSDGYITASSSVRRGRTYCSPRVGISGTRREPHDLAAALFGGAVRLYKPRGDRAHHRDQYQWVREGDPAALVINAVRPFLRVKLIQAALALELHDWQQEVRDARTADNPFPWAPVGWDPTSTAVALAEDIRSYNTRGRVQWGGATPKANGRELDGRTWDEYPTEAAS